MTANGGPIATSYSYEPFGATTQGGASNTNPYQFTGRENDGTGLYYYRARYYSPTFQRFVSQDPIGFAGGLNLYGYALESPTNWIDLLGLDVTIIEYNGADGNPFGHLAIGVNNQTPVGLEGANTLYDDLATAGVAIPGGITVPGLLTRSSDTPYASITIKTTPAQDEAVEGAILRNLLNPPNYNVYHSNCSQEVGNILRGGGLPAPSDVRPDAELHDLAKHYGVPIQFH